MKRNLLLITMIIVAALLISGCGKSDDQNSVNNQPGIDGATESVNTSTDTDENVGTQIDSENIIFIIKGDYVLNSDSWLGVIPTGTLYKNEIDVDELDMVYAYPENYEEDYEDGYYFSFSRDYFFGIENGIYDMVICDTDDGEVGKVILQFGIEIKDGAVTIDMDNKK